MKIHEIIVEEQLDEGWKSAAAKAAAIGAIGLGGAAYDYLKDPANGPEAIKQIVKQVKPNTSQKPTQKIVEPKKVTPSAPQSVVEPKLRLSTTMEPQLHPPVEGGIKISLPPSASPLYRHAIKAGLKGAELAQFLAQASHETMNFTRFVEIGNDKYFRKYDIKYNPAKAKKLGNTFLGDGIKFKGRGGIQITGRWLYEQAAKALGLPLVEYPEMVEDPEIGAKVSIWYWNTMVKPKISDFTNTKEVTRIINPGLRGLDDRAIKFKHFYAQVR